MNEWPDKWKAAMVRQMAELGRKGKEGAERGILREVAKSSAVKALEASWQRECQEGR